MEEVKKEMTTEDETAGKREEKVSQYVRGSANRARSVIDEVAEKNKEAVLQVIRDSNRARSAIDGVAEKNKEAVLQVIRDSNRARSAIDGVAEKNKEAVSQVIRVGANRARSGIPGFDELTNGGLIRNRAYLAAGSAGTGKTIFSMQFIHSGIVKYGENGVYVTLEETPEQLRRDMFSFGWNLKKLENEGRLILLDASSSRVGFGSKEKFVVPRPFTLDALVYEVNRCIEKTKAKRVVIDCLDAMGLHAKDVEEFRKSLLKLTMILKSFECTSLLISESFDGKAPSRYGVEEFVSDGMIMLHHALDENISEETTLDENPVEGNLLQESKSWSRTRSRRIEVIKMRGSDHSHDLHKFVITQDGIIVESHPEVKRSIRRAVFKARPIE